LFVTVEVLDAPQPAAGNRSDKPFELDAAMAALPPPSEWIQASVSERGQAGSRLSAKFTTNIPDDLLAEMARQSLGAERCGRKYLSALRIVLGNQARAERIGYVLEMNQRVEFATPKAMRNIIDQMRGAPNAFGRVVRLGQGRSQEVLCFANRGNHGGTPAEQLERLYRLEEGEAPYAADLHPAVHDEELHRFAPA